VVWIWTSRTKGSDDCMCPLAEALRLQDQRTGAGTKRQGECVKQDLHAVGTAWRGLLADDYDECVVGHFTINTISSKCKLYDKKN